MHYLIYQITNTKNGKIYIGCHQTVDPNDGYMGSGDYIKNSIKKHGIDFFTKTILHDLESPEAMFAKEAELVTEEFINRSDTYNIKVGGKGGWDYVNNEGLGLSGSRKGAEIFHKKTTQEKHQIYKQVSKTLKHHFKSNPGHFAGKSHTPETIAKQKKAHKGQAKGSKNPLFGKKWMTNGTDSKPATKEEQELLLTTGWRYGRII